MITMKQMKIHSVTPKELYEHNLYGNLRQPGFYSKLVYLKGRNADVGKE